MEKPPAIRSTGRRSRTSELDELILTTGRSLIATRGLDETSAARLAEAAGTSIGPIYSRYDAMEDLAVELWRSGACEVLNTLLALVRASNGGELTARTQLAAVLSLPDEMSQVLVELLGVARRYPFLREVVIDDLEWILKTHLQAQSEVPGSVALAQVHIVLGGILLAPVGLAIPAADHLEVVELTATLTNDLAARSHPPVECEPTVFALAELATGDALLDAFTKAVLEVIAQVGYAKASANRIARRAGHGFSSIYSHFETKDEFMEVTTNLLIDQLIAASATRFIGSPRDEFIASSVATTSAMIAESNRLNRYLRTEVVLAARHHRAISDHMKVAYEEILACRRSAAEQAAPNLSETPASAFKALSFMIRYQELGLALLRSTTAMATRFDWTPCSVGLWNLTETSLLKDFA